MQSPPIHSVMPSDPDAIRVPPIVVDRARLAALDDLVILDTPAEQGFDDVVRLATRLCATPVALVSLVAADRQWFKARIGFPPCETDLNSSVCAHALAEPDLLIVPDLTADPRTAANPLVTGEPHIRFYAGAPLRLKDGQVVGSLCVIDTAPRPGGLTPEQADDLRALGRQVSDLLEMRRALGARDALIAEQSRARDERRILTTTQAAIASAGGDLDVILDAVTAGAMQAIPAAEGAVVEFQHGEELEYRVAAGTLGPHRSLRVALVDSLAGRCVRSGSPILADDVLRDGQVRPALAEMLGLRSAVLAPIERAGHIVGVLKLQAAAACAFAERDLELVRLFAGAATTGLTEVAEAEAGRARRKAQDRLDLLARISAALISAEDPARAVGPILASAAERLGFDQSYLYDVAPDGRHLMLTQAIGATEDMCAALRHVDVDAPLCGIVAQTGRLLVLTGVLATDEPRYAMARQVGINAFAGYPVTSRGTTVGVISFCANGEPAFDAEALGFFETVARYLSAVRERLDGERALRDSDARSRRAQEAGHVGTFEVDVDTGLMSVSPEFAKIYGRPPTGVYSTDAFESLILPEDRGVGSSDESRQAGTAVPDVQYRIRRADDGDLRWIARRATFDRDVSGRVIRMFGTVQDVTAQRLAQEALRESEGELRLVIESAKDHAILTTDPAGTVTSWSAGAQAAFEWSADEIVGRSAEILFTPEDRAADVPARELTTAAREGCSNDERWHLTKGGERVFMNGSVHPLPLDAQGRERGFIKIARDETDRRHMEETLRESEERFRTILDTVDAAFAIVEVKFDADDRPVDYRFVEANPAFERQAGVNLRGKWVTEFAPDLERFWFETYGHVARTGEPANFENYAEAFKRWFDVRAVRVGKPEERRIAILFNDVTPRKQAEAALRASEAVARENVERVQLALAAGAIIGTWHWDLPTDRFTVDEAFARSFGLDPALGREGIPLAQIVATVHPDDQAGLAAAINEAIARGGAYAHQYRVRRADGRYYWLEANGRVDHASDGTPLVFPGVLLDVEDKRAAQRRRDMLLQVGDLLRDADGEAVVIAGTSELLGTGLGLSRVGYGAVERDGATLRIDHDWCQPGLPSLAGSHALDSYGRFVEALRRGETVAVSDVTTDPRTADMAGRLVDVQGRAFVNIPVMERGRFVGVFFMLCDEPRTWSEEEVAFLRNAADRIRAALGRLESEERQRLLNEEISHRLKNTFAMVLSIAGQTLRTVADRAPVEVFEQRIHALSSAHDVLLRKAWAAAPAKDVVEAVLASAGHADRIEVSGPEIDLGPRATLSLSLLLHELATNAAKYGALSVPSGRVAVDWHLDGEGDDREVSFDWVERGGPPVAPPATTGRKGFGSRLISVGLAGTGGVDLRYPPSGFQATMRAPLVQLQQS